MDPLLEEILQDRERREQDGNFEAGLEAGRLCGPCPSFEEQIRPVERAFVEKNKDSVERCTLMITAPFDKRSLIRTENFKEWMGFIDLAGQGKSTPFVEGLQKWRDDSIAKALETFMAAWNEKHPLCPCFHWHNMDYVIRGEFKVTKKQKTSE